MLKAKLDQYLRLEGSLQCTVKGQDVTYNFISRKIW